MPQTKEELRQATEDQGLTMLTDVAMAAEALGDESMELSHTSDVEFPPDDGKTQEPREDAATAAKAHGDRRQADGPKPRIRCQVSTR